MILLDHTTVSELLPMAECIDLMRSTLGALARGEATLPLRTVLRLPAGNAAFGMMPAALHNQNVVGLKAITVFPENRGTRWESHQGVYRVRRSHRRGRTGHHPDRRNSMIGYS